MSPKELLYVEDALGHEKILKAQCQQALNELTDPEDVYKRQPRG